MTDRSRPSLEDVAKAARVSTATISRCINAPDKVAGPTRLRIQNAIEALGYVPHFGGRALARNRTNTIGAIIPTMDNAMFASGLQTFQETLSTAGVTLLVGSSNYDTDNEYDQIRSLMSQGADGLLLIGQARPQKTIDLLNQHNVPHVLAWCNNPDAGAPTVGFNNHQSAREMAQHVIDHGHRNLAILAGLSASNDRAADRVAGIKDAIQSNEKTQLTAIENVKYGLTSAGDGFERIWANTTKPTAIICGSDVLAVGAMLRAAEMGLQIPHDVSITGFDDINLARVTNPGLTTVHIPQREMGRQAANVLLNILSTPASLPAPTHVKLTTKIVDRGTLRRL